MAPLVTFYGDDFTGSSAVMEVLSFAGIPTMLFMDAPTQEVLDNFPDLRAVGVAGIARSKDPDWMSQNLPPVFDALKALKAPLMHYKVCSTFDSSPTTGSIGTATQIGADILGSEWIPLVVGAPAIGRYQAFGNLFASAGDANYRLDRHPVMSRHPVTPMNEADLGQHLSHQTDWPVGVVDLAAMKSGRSEVTLSQCRQEGARIIALDVIDDETLVEAGRMIWRDGSGPGFAVGSQGIEYALVAHWRASGMMPPDQTPPTLSPVEQLFAVSGSCAPTTADQIAFAQNAGFKIVEFDAPTAMDAATLSAETGRVLKECLHTLSEGQDVLVATARGPDDPRIARMNEAVSRSGQSSGSVNDRLGQALGQLVYEVRKQTGLPRTAIGGGDTSGHALSALEADALSAVAPLAPGAPLCRVHSATDADIDGLEVTLKGGQMGEPSFFIQAKGGHIN